MHKKKKKKAVIHAGKKWKFDKSNEGNACEKYCENI